MTSTHNIDSVEPQEQIELAMAAFARLRTWLDAFTIVERPQLGSMLAAEDAINPYEPPSHLAGHYHAVASDNLGAVLQTCLEATADGTRGIPAFALYSQLRGSVEAAGWANWLLMNNRKSERTMRALRGAYGHAEDFESMIRSLGEEWPAEARKQRIREIKDAVPQLRQRELTSPPKNTDMLRTLNRFGLEDRLTPLNAWKLCSGVAHGSRQVVYTVSERRRVGTANATGGASVQMFARLVWLASIATVAQTLLEASCERYNYLATRDYAGRPIPAAG